MLGWNWIVPEWRAASVILGTVLGAHHFCHGSPLRPGVATTRSQWGTTSMNILIIYYVYIVYVMYIHRIFELKYLIYSIKYFDIWSKIMSRSLCAHIHGKCVVYYMYMLVILFVYTCTELSCSLQDCLATIPPRFWNFGRPQPRVGGLSVART